MSISRHSLKSDDAYSGRTRPEYIKDPDTDQHSYLGRTSGNWDFNTRKQDQSAGQNCDCEVMKENTGVQESNREHQLRDPDYGEPFRTQCLKIDFTPIPGLDDNPDTLDKVTTFWNYIRSCKQLERFMVLPDPAEQAPSEVTTSETTHYLEPEVGGLQWLQKPKTTYKLQTMSKLPEAKYCPYDVVTDGYVMNDENDKFGVQVDKLAPLTKPSTCDVSYCKNTDTHKLCQVMDDFDRKHPKSMEPPGHPPPLNYAFLKRIHSSIALKSDKPKDEITCDCPKS